MISPSAPWPFVGRSRELDAALDELTNPTSAGVLLVGPAGVGKTRLLDEVAAEMNRRGRLSNRAVGATATQDIPYAAIAHLIPQGAIGEGGPDPMTLFMEISNTLRAVLPPGERFVMGVDDVALLDPASLTLCSQLVNAGLASLLATVRTDHAIPPALSSLERSQPIGRVEVGTFDIDGVIELLEAVQGGTFDRLTCRALWGASQGNLLYLRELVHGALASGALASERGHWRLVAPLAATSRLVEVVSGRLDGLPSDARELAEVLALAEPLRIEDLEAAGLGDAALVLDDARLVMSSDVDGNTLVRLAHPMYGEVLRSQLTPLRRRSLLLRAANAVSAAGRPGDALRLATWLTSAGAPVDPAILREGALRARAANDFVLTEVLARAAVDRHPDLEMLVILGDSLHEFGRVDEADRVLAQAAEFVQGDEDRLLVANIRHRVRLWGSCNPQASLDVLNEAAAQMAPGVPRAMIQASLANTVVFDVDPAATIGVIEPGDAELERFMAHPSVIGHIHHARAVMMERTGDPVGAAQLAARASAEATNERTDHPVLLMNAQTLALTDQGDLDGAEAVCNASYAIVSGQQIPQLHSWVCLGLGRIALSRGRPVTARRWWAEALSVAVDHPFATGRRMALSGLAIVAGQVNDVHAAATLLAELEQLPDDVEFMVGHVAMGKAWSLVALGRVTEAVAALQVGIDRATACGDLTMRLEIRFDAARIGGAGTTKLDADDERVTGALAAAQRAFITGINNGSRSELAMAEEQFATMGAMLSAAEAAAALAAVLTQDNKPREAAAASARSAAHAQHCEGASTPTLVRRATVTELTRREREIGLLAVRGLASKAIARELGVTERTVSNHLQNAYVKLGISNRADLAEALGLTADEARR